jgi:hypothetical protein
MREIDQLIRLIEEHRVNKQKLLDAVHGDEHSDRRIWSRRRN